TATIELESFNHEIAAAAAERGFTKDINVITQSITDGDGVGIPVLEDALRALVEKRREMVSSAPLKAIFIGELDQDKQNRMNEVLNHFRNIRINGVYPYRSIISDKIAFIDPAKYAAMDCYRILRQNNNLSLRITEPVVKVITMPKDTIFQAVDTVAVPADTIPETANGAGQGEMKPSAAAAAAIDAVAPAPASAGSTKVAEPISQKAVEELLK
ncbi:MAG: hypothetical protein HUJ93_06025, partial [Bacteroidales bacterium]|nr:hypothetical protein [Bacteroidales bacterium]